MMMEPKQTKSVYEVPTVWNIFSAVIIWLQAVHPLITFADMLQNCYGSQVEGFEI